MKVAGTRQHSEPANAITHSGRRELRERTSEMRRTGRVLIDSHRFVADPLSTTRRKITKHSEASGASCGTTVSDDYVEN
jgi:hypothetical protein